ncbi:ATP-dependent 6-phosphofructokinase, platelet type isoform X1, partial [Tachysurus ichikawai]
MSKPDTKKFFENLSGAEKAIAVLTSGGDAQGTVSRAVGCVPNADIVPTRAHFLGYILMSRLYNT